MSVLMGFTSEFSVYLIGMIQYGAARTTVQTAVTTLLQERTDPSAQGRGFGLLGSIYSGCMPVGMAIFGPLADVIPLQGMIGCLGNPAGCRRGGDLIRPAVLKRDRFS